MSSMQTRPENIKKMRRQGHINVPGVLLSLGVQGLLAIIFLLFSLFAFKSTYAQINTNLLIQPPDTTAFPNLTLQFKLLSTSGLPETGLQVDQLSVFENDKPVPVLSLQEEKKGVHFSLVLNGGYDLDRRDVNGDSLYEHLSTVLVGWASSRTFNSEDVWSFVTPEGAVIKNTHAPTAWISAFDAYQPNFRSMEPNLHSLETALQMARDRTVAFGVDKTLLYITLPPPADQIDGLYALAANARTNGIHVNVWMVGDAYYLTNAQGLALMDLADTTQGHFFHVSDIEEISDPEDYLTSLGSLYTLTYQSALRETGNYSLRVEAVVDGEQISGESVPFFITICPPKPILISPPVSVTRQGLSVTAASAGGPPLSQVKLNFMVSFPDGYDRDLSASRLFVDGRLVAEREIPPHDTFVWDLEGYSEPGEHMVQIEVEDSLGLSSRTILTPIQVIIEEPITPSSLSRQQIGWIFSGVVLAGALSLLLFWFVRRWWTNPVSSGVRTFISSFLKNKDSSHKPVASLDRKILAVLIPSGVLEKDWEQSANWIIHPEITIGSDASIADLVIKQPGISGLQSHLIHLDGQFWIKDHGSALGTWVNYQRIGTEPVLILPGDILHFGHTEFRFTMKEQIESSHVTIKPYEPNL